MSRLQSLKDLIYKRLTAAVDEIIVHLERTITEYEEEMECRQRTLLDTGSEPGDKVQSAELSADVRQPLLIKEEQQEWSPHLEQECPEHVNIKEEKDEAAEFPFAQVPVKSEDDGRACAGSECLSRSNDETPRSAEDRKEVRKPQTDLITVTNKVNDTECNTGNKSFSCPKCGKRFGQKHHLQTHMRLHTGEKPFSCPLCEKRFTQKGNLNQHMTVHTREKPCNCPVCGERFAQKGNLTQHMTVHTREKPCNCPVCGERFAQKGNLTQHMTVHTREKLYC